MRNKSVLDKPVAAGGASDHGALTGLADDDHSQYHNNARGDARYALRENEWGQSGFVDIADSDLSWDDGSRTLTLEKAVTSFDYYIAGIKYTETGTLTEQIADEAGLWIFYFDSEGSITSAKNPSESDIDTVINNYTFIAYVYWDGSDGRLMEKRHGYQMSPTNHHWIHNTTGALYKDGMSLADFVIGDGNTNSHAQFSIASGSIYNEDLKHTLSAVTKATGLEIWYLDGSVWKWTTNAGYSVRTTGSGRLAWNDSGSQTEVTNRDFVLCHVFATNITDDSAANLKFITIQGQAKYNTRRLAREGAETEINSLVYGTLPLQEIVPIATVIFQTASSYSNAVKGRVRTTESDDNYVDWRVTNLKSSGGLVSDHGALAGLGDDDHPQYMIGDSSGSFKNKIINGNFNIWQRGTVITSPSNADYTADRWQVQHVGAMDMIVSRDAEVPTFAESGFHSVYSYLYKIDIEDTSIATTDLAFIDYKMEGYDYQALAGKECMLSFWVKSDLVGIYCIAFKNSGSDRSYIIEYEIDVADTWEKKEISITFNETGGTWDYTTGKGLVIIWALACGSTYHTTPGAWQTGNYVASSNQVNFCYTDLDEFRLSQVQIEVGSKATRFEARSHQTELVMAKRYYERWTGVAYTPMGAGVQQTTTIARAFVAYVPKRVQPTVDWGTLVATYGTTTQQINTINDSECWYESAWIDWQTVGTSIPAGQAIVIIGMNDSSGYVAFDAEI